MKKRADSGPTDEGDETDTDKRVQRSKKAVRAATMQLLAKTGFSGVSVDEVSRRSGVAKTTIYRHWPSRAALLLDACSNLSTGTATPDTGSFEGDLVAMATVMARRLQSDRWATILPSVIDAAERDRELAEVHTRLHAGFMTPLFSIVERARERKQLARDCDASEVVALLVGPLYYRRWFSREPLDADFVRAVAKGVAEQFGR